ncbi:hypothetical protein P3T76_013209 [Phytophthora citrophthora]|uniref:Jacalin-type lectin domain-containing protein n=1 Tax=Phytophthora citrophthora TaxID=4793 RepID=A0AAD9G4Q5_9STRA|nr:hypothetical protein P3T76_013209 [Phytophthora citrophthora]
MPKFFFHVLVLVLLVASSVSAHAQLDFGKLANDAKEYLNGKKTEAPAPAPAPAPVPATESKPLHPLVSGTVFGANDGAASVIRDAVEPGEKVRGVTIRTGERVDGVGIIHQNLFGKPEILHNDRDTSAPRQTLWLASGEYFKTIEAHTGEKDGRKTIFFIKLTTNLGNSISGGTPTSDIGTETAEEGYQIGGFVGGLGDEIESIGAIWATLKA